MNALREAMLAMWEPLRGVGDPAERIYWPFLVGALALPLVLLGVRGGLAVLRSGLFCRALWLHPSSRADVLLLLARAVFAAWLKVPWLAATTAASLWFGLSLHRWLGPTPFALRPDSLVVTAVYTLVLFLAWDLSRFVLHRAMHRVVWLWSFHQVHHSAEVLTPLTLYRTHPLETFLFDLRGLVTTAVVAGTFVYLFPGSLEPFEIAGIHALGFLCNAAGANLRHSHVWLGFGKLERWLLSPAQHQLHHSCDPQQQNRNFGTYLAFWDRWAQTWLAAPKDPPRGFGLIAEHRNHDPARVGSMLIDPLFDRLRMLPWRRKMLHRSAQ